MRGRDKFKKVKPVINFVVMVYSFFPRRIRLKMLESSRKDTGSIALFKRYCLLKTLAKSVGENVAIYPDVYFKNVQNLEIGNNVSFQPMSYIEAYGGIFIGDDVSIAEGASMFSVTHGIKKCNIPIKDQDLTPLPIEIKDNVWVGSKATILGGVTISTGCVVAAGAVVKKSFSENCVIGGVPARVLKERK